MTAKRRSERTRLLFCSVGSFSLREARSTQTLASALCDASCRRTSFEQFPAACAAKYPQRQSHAQFELRRSAMQTMPITGSRSDKCKRPASLPCAAAALLVVQAATVWADDLPAGLFVAPATFSASIVGNHARRRAGDPCLPRRSVRLHRVNVSAAIVPEPATWVLSMVGAMLIAVNRWRARHARAGQRQVVALP